MDLCLILNPKQWSLLLILLQWSCTIQAQFLGSPPTSHETNGLSSILAALFGTIAVIFFGIALFSVCFYVRVRQYINDISTIRPGAGTARTTTSEPGERRRQRGIDHSVLNTFPIMEYAAVKELSTVKGLLECAVCLSEFADDGSLKLLPGCCHVFHPECIDQWLENHITCPVCRADLTKPSVTSDSTDATSEATGTGTVTTEGNVVRHNGESGEPSAVIHTVDRFTLRLPRHVLKEIEDARKYRRSVSVAGYSYERRGSTIGRSGRLQGFIRSFSSVLRREPHASELPMNTRSIGSSSLSGQNQDQRSPNNASPIALLAGYDRS